jgi:hypothetical protein
MIAVDHLGLFIGSGVVLNLTLGSDGVAAFCWRVRG